MLRHFENRIIVVAPCRPSSDRMLVGRHGVVCAYVMGGFFLMDLL